jgi:hypothetical protein
MHTPLLSMHMADTPLSCEHQRGLHCDQDVVSTKYTPRKKSSADGRKCVVDFV